MMCETRDDRHHGRRFRIDGGHAEHTRAGLPGRHLRERAGRRRREIAVRVHRGARLHAAAIIDPDGNGARVLQFQA